MNHTGTLLKGNEVGKYNFRFTVNEGMLYFQFFNLVIGNISYFLERFTGNLTHHFRKAFSQDEKIVLTSVHRIGEIRVKGHRQVCRQRPWSGGPDRYVHVIAVYSININRSWINREFHVDGWGLVIIILHLCFGKCGHAVGAPVYWFFPPVYKPRLKQRTEYLNDGCLVILD